MKRIKVHTVSKKTLYIAASKGKESIVSKYAYVPSESKPGTVYTVVRYRRGVIVNAQSRTLRYSCTCPGFQFRLKVCKHIRAFQKSEKGS